MHGARTDRKPIPAAILQETQLNQITLAILQAADRIVAEIQAMAGGEADSHFLQMFTNAATISVLHGLGRMPGVTCYDMDNTIIAGFVDYVDTNQIIVRFNSPTTGCILCN